MVKPAIWFWQRIVSPHMAGLAAALARQGCEVVYVAEKLMSEDRARQGWTAPDLEGTRLELAPTASAIQALAQAAPEDSIHICQGIRANGLVCVAQRVLARRGVRQWVVMETVEDSGWCGLLKRLEYRRLFMRWRTRIEGVLATGHRTPAWVVAQGMPEARVYPFAYFLPDRQSILAPRPEAKDNHFRFMFVGQFIERKRLDLLITALAGLSRKNFELAIIGSGPLEQQWQDMAEALLPGQVDWIGRLPLEQVQEQMARADCLVLPSRHDGWGAVVPESLMVGTPTICSDACGAAGVVLAIGIGGIFESGDAAALTKVLAAVVENGRLKAEERVELVEWARCLGAEAGAKYLKEVLDSVAERNMRPLPPWQTTMSRMTLL